jgi:cadherin EGF LAG seven-pass G-type receptor 1
MISVQDVRIDQQRNLWLKSSVEHRVSDGCSSSDSCTAKSDICPQRGTCADTWNSHKCSCDSGFVGPDCANICEYNPCENNATCQIDTSNRRGYKCGCQGDTSGDYCEVTLDQPCPATWWGYPVCGPCRCDTDKGYDPNCNKTNGQCVCQVRKKTTASIHFKSRKVFFSFCPCNYTRRSSRMLFG